MILPWNQVGASDAKVLQENIKPLNLDPTLLLLKLKFGKISMAFEMASIDLLTKLLAELKQMLATAVTENYSSKKTSHIWALFYSQPPAELLNLMDNENTDLLAKKSHLDPAEQQMADNPFLGANFKEGTPYVQDSFKSIKQNWITKQMMLREKEFTDYTSLILFSGTWNVNGKYCAESLGPWLNSYPDKEPDIYALGFQEVDLSAGAFLLDNSIREDDWTKLMESGFKKRNQYKKVVSKQLVGMLLLIYCKADLLPFVKEVCVGTAATGVLGLMGNKGGVGVRMRVFDSIFCFLNSHLAAGSEELERRNSDFKDICRKLAFIYPATDGSVMPKYCSIFDSDYLVWFGDFNYRISQPDAEIRTQIEKKEYQKLLKYDQLTNQRIARRAFAGFEEGPVNFHPSYKYDPGTDVFDTSEKRRSPAWCDRILWRSGDKLEQLTYNCHMELKTSDHKPVSSVFEVSKVKMFSKEKMTDIQMEIVRELDKFENEIMPDASLSENHVDFGIVKYLVPITKGIVLENTGQVLAQFQFIPKLEETSICKPFIWVSPTTGMLLPGDKTLISITVLVDNRTAPSLNKGTEHLDDILVLHLVNGKDFFISLSGNFMKTCFGTPLETLVKLTGPLRLPSHGKNDNDTSQQQQLSVPKELWRMADYIYKNGLDMEGLFVTAGEFEEMEMIRDCLDEGRDFTFAEGSHSSVFSMCETLLRFLEALPDPVVPFAMYQRCLDSYQFYQLARQAVSNIPQVHYNVFVYLTAFLREVLSHSNANGLTVENLSLIFSSVLLRSPKSVAERYREVVDKRKTAFLSHFLNLANEIN